MTDADNAADGQRVPHVGGRAQPTAAERKPARQATVAAPPDVRRLRHPIGLLPLPPPHPWRGFRSP